MAGQGPKTFTVTQVQIDNMLAQASDMGNAKGWKRGFLAATACYAAGALFALVMKALG